MPGLFARVLYGCFAQSKGWEQANLISHGSVTQVTVPDFMWPRCALVTPQDYVLNGRIHEVTSGVQRS